MKLNSTYGKGVSALLFSVFSIFALSQQASAQAGAALNFDGTDDYVETNANITNLNDGDFTIEAWVKTSGNGMGIVTCTDNDGAWEDGEKAFYINSSGQPWFVGYANDYIRSTVSVNDNTWHHVAVVWNWTSGNSGIGKMYVDGADVTGFNGYQANRPNAGTFKIGRANFLSFEAPNYFSGSLDEVRIWNIALSHTQILANMNCEITAQPGLVAAYHFNNGIASGINTGVTTLNDGSGSGYDGTLNNFALTGSTSNWVAPGGVTSGNACPPCIVNIPDANFKTALLSNPSINTNSDGEIQCSEALAFTGTIDVNDWGIYDLTGIEAFINATGLHIEFNNLSTINLTALTQLTYVNCSFNQLSSLNISGLTSLHFLDLSYNTLSSIDISSNYTLTNLYLQQNTLSSINLSGIAGLIQLNLDNNNLSALDVSTNTALQYLSCGANSIAGLDASALTSLVQLYCYSNQLTSLNIQNGNNTNLANFNATSNPGLTCIQVDDASFMNANWSSGKDAGATFSIECSNPVVAGASLNFDGVNDYVEMSDFNLGSSDFTVETWINPQPLATSAYIITNRSIEGGGDGNWWNLQLQASNIIGFEMGADGSESYTFMPGNMVLSSGNWYHIAAVRQGTHISLYVNGALDAEYDDDFVRNLTTGLNTGRLGGWVNFNLAWYNGSMDEVRVWHTAHSQGQIQAEMNCEITPQPGLAAAYHFNEGYAGGDNLEGGSSLEDGSGNGNEGTLFNFALNGATSNWAAPGGVTTGNACETAPPIPAAALNFDGANDYIDVSPLVPYSSDFTVEGWIKTSSVAGPSIFGWGNSTVNGYVHAGLNNGRLRLAIGDGNGIDQMDGNTLVNDDQWHHVAFVKSGTSVSFYLDGNADGTASTSLSPATITSTIIGGGLFNNIIQAFFVGNMDELRIWNIARSQSEIQANMNCEVSPQFGLAAAYHFNQGYAEANNLEGGNFLTDESGNGHNGTLSNFALNGATSNWVAPGGVTTGNSCETPPPTPAAALSFDGADDYVRVYGLNIPQPYTIETWVKFNSANARVCAVDANEMLIDIVGTDQIRCQVEGPPNEIITAPGTIVYGQWMHIACVFDGANSAVYINGALAGTGDLGTEALDATHFDIGATGDPFMQNPINGQMDEFRIWNVDRTLAQIQSDMNCEIPSQVGLVAAYHFNEGNAGGINFDTNGLTDATGNGHDGELINFALTGNTSNWIAPGGVATGNACETTSQSSASALNFDGVDDVGEHTGYLVPAGNSPYTVSVWAKQDAFYSGSFNQIFAQGRYLYLGQSSINDIRVGDAWLNTGVPWPSDLNYHNYTVVRTTDNTYLYLDGTLAATAGYAIPSPETTGEPGTNNFYIGTQWWGNNQHAESWNGNIDELRVWSRALSALEISNNQNCEVTSATNGLVADYHFNQGYIEADNSGETIVHDNSSNGHDITLHNMALSGTSSNWVDGAAVPTGSSCPVTCEIQLTYTSNNACNEDTTAGSIDLAIANSAAPVSYAWSDENSSEDRTGLVAGTYDVTVTDNNGCSATASIVISQIQCFETPIQPPSSGSDSSSVGAELTGVYNNPPAAGDTSSSTIVTVSDDGYVFIDVIPEITYYDSVLTLIQTAPYGMFDPFTDDTTLIITGYYPIANIPKLDTLHAHGLLNFSRNAIPPILNNVGLFNTGGDEAQRADTARKIFNVSGSGIKVGVLSDSYNKISGNPAGLDVSNRDLPGADVTEIPVQIMQDYPYGTLSDEGRGILQIIHDVAPGAALEFRTGYISPADMADGIRQLATDGCKIIVDDITYPTEPFYQDGIVSNAVNEVTAQGVSYFTAAGNFGSRSYAGVFTGAGDGNAVHKFGVDGDGHDDTLQSVTLAPGRYTIVMQWDNQFYSLNQLPGAADDLDIFVVSNGGTKIGMNRKNNWGDPVEMLSFQVKGTSPVTTNIMVRRPWGTTSNLKFKYVVFRGSMTINEYSQGTSTIVGQANCAGAITVGAARYTQTPAYGVTPPTNETFSSRGGQLINDVDRSKPDITAPDGGNTSVNFGSPLDLEGDSKPNFYGTSAAAPHAAAVAALIQEAKNKFTGSAATPGEVRSMLKSTAIDMADDAVSGSGLVQADLAIETFANPAPILLSMTPEVGASPGSEIFSVDVYGEYFATGATLMLRQVAVPTTVIDATHLVAEVPVFVGNPAVQVYNPPRAELNADGGYSDTLFFYTSTRQTINIVAADRTKKYGERLPSFSANITVNGVPIESTSLSLSDLKLDNIVFATNATSTSNTGYYYIRPSSATTLDPNNAEDAALLDAYTYHFEDGLLTINKMPLNIRPENMTVGFGDKIDGRDITYTYTFDQSQIDAGELAAFTTNLSSGYEGGIIKEVALIDDRTVVAGNTLSEQDIDNLAVLSGSRGVINGSRGVINGSRAIANGDPYPDTTYVVDVDYTSLVQYNADGANVTLTDEVTLLNGSRGVINGSRGVINSESLVDGTALINGSRAVANGSRAVANGSRGVINGEELDGSSNSNTAVIIHETDLNQHEDPDVSFDLLSINCITGLTAGSHWIIPGGFMSANFDVSYELGTLNISPAALTLTADDKNSLCAGVQPTYTSSADGLQYDDTIGNVFSSVTYQVYDASNALMGSGALAQGDYSIHPNGVLAQPSNYALSNPNNGTLSVAAPLVITATGNILCHDGSATVTVNVTGGTQPYSSANSYPNQGPGQHTYDVSDAQGCTATVTINLVNPPAITASVRTTPALCGPGGGSIDVSPAGGTPGYTYLWSPGGQTNNTATGLASGNYSVRVTDANGCSATFTATLTNPSAITAAASTIANTSCSTPTSGSARVVPAGGTGAYTYLWLPSGGNSATASNLSAGIYTARVTDANGCSATSTATVTLSFTLTATASTIANATCYGGSNGSARVVPGGGSAPYSYSWMPSGGSSATASNLAAGTYTVRVTDAGGCSITATTTITQPPALVVNAGADEDTYYGYTADQAVTHTAVASGGTPPYTYSWRMNRPLLCNQVNSAGDESFASGTCTNNTCPTSGSPTIAPSCTGSATVAVTLTDTAFIISTVRDACGNTAIDTFKVRATDARCFAGNSNNGKVIVCHHAGNQWVQLCVAQEAVPSMLAQGDLLGACHANGHRPDGLDEENASYLSAYPNPFSDKTTIVFNVPADGNTVVKIFDAFGREIGVLFDGIAKSGTEYKVEFDGAKYARGTYFYNIVSREMNETKKLELIK
jgi:hypothetical protein